MKYIMTGTEGLIGGFLKQRLDEEGHESVLEVDNRKGSNVLNINSLRLNPKTQQTDIMYHLAAQCKINEAIEHPDLPHKNNADGTHEVLEFCRKNGIPKVMFFSSSRVLADEENPYTASKKYGEHLCKAYSDCYGLEHIIVRPSTVYGPVHDVTSRLMTDWCQAALADKELPLYGDHHKTLDFTHVDDFVGAIMLLTNKWDEAKNRAYNISGGAETNLLGLGRMITDMAGGGHVKMHEQETAQPQQVKVDISDIQALGYAPGISVTEGVKEMLDFYRGRE